MGDKTLIEVTEHRSYQITAQQLGVIIGRAFGIDTRDALLELVTDDVCDSCGQGLDMKALGHAVRLHVPRSHRKVEVGE
tara:strand:- start:328 stop:564 length:237 start_codon:yes stop_codon:yes gene_type:complete